MGAKGNGVNDKQPCAYRYEDCPFVSQVCEREECGFYFRVQERFSVKETIKELELCGLNDRQLRDFKQALSHVVCDAVEFRKQALFRYYLSCDNQ